MYDIRDGLRLFTAESRHSAAVKRAGDWPEGSGRARRLDGAVIQVYGSTRHAWIECDVTTSTRDRPFCECVLDRDICVKKLFQQNRMI